MHIALTACKFHCRNDEMSYIFGEVYITTSKNALPIREAQAEACDIPGLKHKSSAKSARLTFIITPCIFFEMIETNCFKVELHHLSIGSCSFISNLKPEALPLRNSVLLCNHSGIWSFPARQYLNTLRPSRLRIHWDLFWRSNQQYSSIGLDKGLAPHRRQAIILINGG